MSQTRQLAGVDEALNLLRQLIVWPRLYQKEKYYSGINFPQGALIHGPPGTGKTTIVEVVAQEIDATLIKVSGSDIFGAYLGESEERLRNIFEKAQKLQQDGQICVIFFDEIDILCPRRTDQNQNQARLSSQLLTLVDDLNSTRANNSREDQIQGYTIVVGATNRIGVIDLALKRPGRLEIDIIMDTPNLEARLQILSLITKDMKLSVDADLKRIAQMCGGYTGSDLQALCREAALICIQDLALPKRYTKSAIDQSQMSKLQVTFQDFKKAKNKVIASGLRGSSTLQSRVRYEDIGGLDETKHKLMQTIDWPILYKQQFQELNLNVAKGILLYGPPGGAKTMLAQAASPQNAILLSGADLLSSFVGESEENLESTFQKALKNSPCAIIIDEIDVLVGKRQSQDQGQNKQDVSLRFLATFLTQMDALEAQSQVFVIGTTNRPWEIDDALLRPGRFDVKIYVPYPDLKSRTNILQLQTSKIPLSEDVNLADIAELTEGYSGAELRTICKEAAIKVLREQISNPSSEIIQKVQQKHFSEVISSMKPMSDSKEIFKFLEWQRKIHKQS